MGLDWPQAWLLGLPTAVVYGSLALFTSILHNVFLLYYVDTFVSVYKINKLSFWIGEVSQAGAASPGGRRGHQVSRHTEELASLPVLGTWGRLCCLQDSARKAGSVLMTLQENSSSAPDRCLRCPL